MFINIINNFFLLYYQARFKEIEFFINILYFFETEDIDSVEKCAKTLMKKYQYRKYKEVYQVNIDIIKEVISSCGKIPENIKFKENQDNKYLMHISKE